MNIPFTSPAAALIFTAAIDGVKIELVDDRIRVTGGTPEARTKWLPAIRDHKAELLAIFEVNSGKVSTPPTVKRAFGSFGSTDGEHISKNDAGLTDRQKRALALLEADPTLHRGIVVDADAPGDCVIVAVAIRGKGLAEMLIPKDRFDPFKFAEKVAASEEAYQQRKDAP